MDNIDNKFVKNQIIWGKIAGYPWWPCFVKNIMSQDDIEVCYLGDFSRSFLKNSQIRNYDEIKKPLKPGKKLQKSINIADSIIEGKSTVEEEIKKYKINFEENLNENDNLNNSDLITQADNIYEVRKIQTKIPTYPINKTKEIIQIGYVKNQLKAKRLQNSEEKKKIKESLDFPHFSDHISNSSNIRIYEEKLFNFLEKIKNIDFNNNLEFFEFENFIELILQENNKNLFNSKVGKYLNCILAYLLNNNSEQTNFIELLKGSMEKIKSKLISGFFNLNQNHHKKNSENIKNQENAIENNIEHKKMQIFSINKSILNSKNIIRKSNFEIESRIRHRVCKKIAKILFLNKDQNSLLKKDCERISNGIEEYLLKSSKNIINYKSNVINVVKYIKIDLKGGDIIQKDSVLNFNIDFGLLEKIINN
jgi:hypothetical protein